MKIHWVTYETHPDKDPRGEGSYKKLTKTCLKRGIEPPVVLGGGSPWTGFSAKWKAVLKFCKRLPREDVVIVTDARDVLCNRGMSGFLAMFNKVSDKGKKVVFGSEVGCCVDPMKEYGPGEILGKNGKKKRLADNSKKWFENEEYGDELDASGYYNNQWTRWFSKIAPKNAKSGVALNAGMGVATASMWKKVIPQLKIQSDSEDDQTLWSSLMYIKSDIIKLDYEGKIFTNTNVWDLRGCFVTWDSKRKSWRNRKTQKYSYILQTPGAPKEVSGAWKCYKEIYKKLI
tara:strand:- start:250 stop:1110 length:861 start_codon:yes stop_codon:yes gene_type:complete